MNIVIRPFESRDSTQIRKLLQDANLSLLWTGFCLASRKPTVSALALCCAISVYIWTGRSVLCLVAAVIFVYGSLYLILKTIVIYLWKGPAITDLNDVYTTYQADPRTNFWVAVEVVVVDDRTANRGDDNDAAPNRVVASIAITQKGDPSVAFLRRVAVNENYRRLGIARKLVRFAVRFCVERGYDAIELVTTEAQNPARRLYEEEGFVHVKTIYLYRCFAMHEFLLDLKKAKKL